MKVLKVFKNILYLRQVADPCQSREQDKKAK